MKRVLIAMSDTGGGHRASAEALAEAFAACYGAGFHVSVVDLWMGYAPRPLNWVPKAYRFLIDDTPELYHQVYRLGENRQVTGTVLEIVARWSGQAMQRVLATYRPDVVVSVHPLLQEVLVKLLAQCGQPIPFVTVVTDLGSFHPTWFHPGASLCVVPTEQGLHQARLAGLRPEQVRRIGLPVRPAFNQPFPTKPEQRRRLGLLPDMPAVLLVGGGEGMGPLDAIARALAARLAAAGRRRGDPAGQLVVVCGRNRALAQRLSHEAWPVPVRIQGFVDEMAQWMAACDCIVTKAGPSTISEAMCLGLPLVVSGFVPGQETGNVAYVLQHGIGTYSPNPERIAETVARWLGPDRATLLEMSRRARARAHPQAALEVVRAIVASM